MKNIHVLPTPNPSRLRINQKGKLILSTIAIGSKGETQNIYITSDEEIKVGDWFINTANNFISFASEEDKDLNNFSYVKKIILTDNKDLIKDGVQAIDDEFLEWFIKNLNCEEVKIVNNWDYNNKGFVDHSGYKIIIPKEEPKQERSYSEEDLDAFRKFMLQEQNFSKSCLDVFVKQIKKK